MEIVIVLENDFKDFTELFPSVLDSDMEVVFRFVIEIFKGVNRKFYFSFTTFRFEAQR